MEKQATREPEQVRRGKLTIRPAERRDAATMAELYVQLWESELPMLLVGGKEPTQRFLERHLLAEDARRLRNNFVAEYEGEIVAMYGVSSQDEPRPPFWREGVLRDIVQCLGVGSLPKLVWPVVQNLITEVGEEWPEVLYMSNLVIKPEFRKHGFGEDLFRHFYEQARERGCDRIAGQVMDPKSIQFYMYMRNKLPIDPKSDGALPRGRLARKFAVKSEMIWSQIPHE